MGNNDSALCHFNWTKGSSQSFSFAFTSRACRTDVGGTCQTVSSFWNRAGMCAGKLAPLSLGQPSLVCKYLLGCLFVARLPCCHVRDICKTMLPRMRQEDSGLHSTQGGGAAWDPGM